MHPISRFLLFVAPVLCALARLVGMSTALVLQSVDNTLELLTGVSPLGLICQGIGALFRAWVIWEIINLPLLPQQFA